MPPLDLPQSFRCPFLTVPLPCLVLSIALPPPLHCLSTALPLPLHCVCIALPPPLRCLVTALSPPLHSLSHCPPTVFPSLSFQVCPCLKREPILLESVGPMVEEVPTPHPHTLVHDDLVNTCHDDMMNTCRSFQTAFRWPFIASRADGRGGAHSNTCSKYLPPSFLLPLVDIPPSLTAEEIAPAV